MHGKIDEKYSMNTDNKAINDCNINPNITNAVTRNKGMDRSCAFDNSDLFLFLHKWMNAIKP